MKGCKPKTWGVRMVVETVSSMLTVVNPFNKVGHRVWNCFAALLAYTMAMFNVLAQRHGLKPDPDGRIHLSIAEFGL